jgi:uncharacterized protein (TIGR00251 family)
VDDDLPDGSVSAFSAHTDHLRLTVRLTPNGGRDAIDGIERDAEGSEYLKARVAAVPEDGKANKALVALLSKTLRVPKSSVTFISGETARKKILRIEGDPEDLSNRLQALVTA